jgi:phosphoglycolate phosphatase
MMTRPKDASRRISALNAILFDMDGTIADSRPGIFASIDFLLRQLGHIPDPGFDLAFVLGPPVEAWIGEVLGHFRDTRLQEGVALYRSHQNETGLFLSSIYPGIAELLGKLRERGVDSYVATAKRTEAARRILNHFGLETFFKSIHGSTPDGKNTDKVALIAEVLEANRLNPANTGMLGDRMFDMEAARKNGLVALGALWGYGTEMELSGHGAWSCFARPLDLMAEFE